MKSKLSLLAVLILAFPLLAGCWSRYEIENLAIVGGMGIDRIQEDGKERYLLTLDVIRPGLSGGGTEGGGRGKPIYWRITATGDTLVDAERNINLRSPRRVFYGHMRFVAISEKIAREKLPDVIDYLARNSEVRLRILILLTRERATDALINYPELENTIARQVTEMASITGGIVSKFKIWDLAQTIDQLITPGLDPVMAELMTPFSVPAEPGGGPIKILRFGGGGVVKKDKLVGWLTDGETRGYLLGAGEAQEGALPVSLKNQPEPDTNINLTRSSRQLTVNVEGNKVTAKMLIHAEGDLGEYNGKEEVATHEGVLKLETKFKEEVEKEVRQSFKKAQELNADIFGLGNRLHERNPKAWKKMEKDWYKILPNVKLEIKVTAHIRRTVAISEPFIPK